MVSFVVAVYGGEISAFRTSAGRFLTSILTAEDSRHRGCPSVLVVYQFLSALSSWRVLFWLGRTNLFRLQLVRSPAGRC